jgi:DNA polymerase-3 subunit delta
MQSEKIIAAWKKKDFHPVYWLEGEEAYEIDQVMDHAENHLLSEQEKSFNLTVFYGRDSQWADIINACRRYPMFAERQVVLLKEAQHMRDIEKLEPYISHPLSSTVFVVSYKDKKVDGRTGFARTLKKNAEMMTTKKLYDNQLPEWTDRLIQKKGLSISPKALALLVDHIGNDLSRISNEVDKLMVNLANRKTITEDDIEQFIGVSKEYNPFELQAAMIRRDLPRAVQIIRYFASNPKAAPIQLVLPTLYNLFSKAYMIFGLNTKDEKAVAAALGVNPFFAKDYLLAAKNYGYEGVERAMLLLHHYNLRSVGASLLKEMAVKMIGN